MLPVLPELRICDNAFSAPLGRGQPCMVQEETEYAVGQPVQRSRKTADNKADMPALVREIEHHFCGNLIGLRQRMFWQERVVAGIEQ